jgi:hypothetical protein
MFPLKGKRTDFLTLRQICNRLGNPKLYHTIRRKYLYDPRAVNVGSGKKNKYILIPIWAFEDDFGGGQ